MGAPQRALDSGVWRTWVDAPGGPIWFESADVALEASAEAFVSALLVPALARSARLSVPAPIDLAFHVGVSRLLRDYYAVWWGYRADALDGLAAGSADEDSPRCDAVAACFTCGVDSFYSLLVPGRRTDVLLFVQGYDMPLDDRERFEHLHRSLERVAEETGARAAVVRTNLREHEVASGVPWERWHGGALAAAGHVCGGAFGTLRIPPSYRMDRLRPWGSDPRTDPLWSSSRLAIAHPVAPDGRVQRIAAIGRHPLVREHLRVCFENRAPHGNCSACEKCLLTMTALDGMGWLDEFTAFDRTIPLAERLDALPFIRDQERPVWIDAAQLDHRPAVRAALKRLFRRTPGRLKRAYWRLRSRWPRRRDGG